MGEIFLHNLGVLILAVLPPQVHLGQHAVFAANSSSRPSKRSRLLIRDHLDYLVNGILERATRFTIFCIAWIPSFSFGHRLHSRIRDLVELDVVARKVARRDSVQLDVVAEGR